MNVNEQKKKMVKTTYRMNNHRIDIQLVPMLCVGTQHLTLRVSL